MSSPELKLIISSRAEEDFADILQYTYATWGETQMLTYRAALNEAFLTLRDNPQLGRVCPELSTAHRLFPAGQHVIVYRIGVATINVSRILHSRMDISKRQSGLL